VAPIFTHLVNFLYILTFFSGISCLTLLVTLLDRGDRLFPEGYVLLRRFILSLLLFLTVNFLMFYRDYFFPFRRAGEAMSLLLLFLFDLLLVVSSYQWIRLNGSAELDRWLVPLRVIACLYIAVW